MKWLPRVNPRAAGGMVRVLFGGGQMEGGPDGWNTPTMEIFHHE